MTTAERIKAAGKANEIELGAAEAELKVAQRKLTLTVRNVNSSPMKLMKAEAEMLACAAYVEAIKEAMAL